MDTPTQSPTMRGLEPYINPLTVKARLLPRDEGERSDAR